MVKGSAPCAMVILNTEETDTTVNGWKKVIDKNKQEGKRRETMKINWNYKVEEGAMDKDRITLAFVIAIALFSAIIWPGILLNIPMAIGAKYTWAVCSVFMFYFCFLRKGVDKFKNIVGAIVTIILGPVAVITIGLAYLIRKRNLNASNRCVHQPCGTH